MNVRNGIESLPQTIATQTPAATTATPAKGTGSPPSGSPGVDQAKLSAAATQASQTANAASVSDVRLDKVASIQSALQAGTYRVPASDVAQKVIASMLAPLAPEK
jgi:flagellar biosynthesis anti-sigma factor FlgM